VSKKTGFYVLTVEPDVVRRRDSDRVKRPIPELLLLAILKMVRYTYSSTVLSWAGLQRKSLSNNLPTRSMGKSKPNPTCSVSGRYPWCMNGVAAKNGVRIGFILEQSIDRAAGASSGRSEGVAIWVCWPKVTVEG
jgi:hypothetical protein